MDSESARKSLAQEKMNKLKLLKMFAKNPTLKDTSTALAPGDEAQLLTQVEAKQKDQRMPDRVKLGS